MLPSVFSHIVVIAMALAFITICAGYPTRRSESCAARYPTSLQGGFGPAAPKASRQSGPDALVNPQLKIIDVEAPCPCSSGLSYKLCCKNLHDNISNRGEFPNPEALTRARYSSFALGLASYIIDTTHPLHRDYKKHSGSNLDPKKARKAWEKEIITKNSEVFDFLKLELLVGDEKIIQKVNETLAEGQESVAFRILVRKRSDGSLISFQESSVYVPMPLNYYPLGLSPKSTSSTGGFSSKNKEKAIDAIQINGDEDVKHGWLYSHGIVTPVSEEIAKRIMGEAPQFLNNLSIRDRW